MKDPRIAQFAGILVDYSTRVKKGDVVLISAAGFEAAPLVKELYALCLKRGAKYVEYSFSNPEIDRQFYNLANRQQLEHFPIVARDERRHERLLVGEILIERADADAGHRGNPVGAGAIVSLPRENTSSCVQQRLHRRLRSLLRR